MHDFNNTTSANIFLYLAFVIDICSKIKEELANAHMALLGGDVQGRCHVLATPENEEEMGKYNTAATTTMTTEERYMNDM